MTVRDILEVTKSDTKWVRISDGCIRGKTHTNYYFMHGLSLWTARKFALEEA